MGPVFSIAFLVPLLIGLNASGKGAGNAAPLAVLLAAGGVLGLGWIVAEYAKRIHAAGSLYGYVTDGLGARVGAVAGFLYCIGMIGGTIHDIIEAEFGFTIAVGGKNDVAAAFSPGSSPSGFGGVLFGVLYGVLLFTGFETAANLGEETSHPQRDIPRAVLFSVLAVAGFYLISAYAQVAGFGFDLDPFGEAAGA